MSSTLTLDDIRAAAERQYSSKVLDLGDAGEVTLVNPLRLSKTKRDEFLKLHDRTEDADTDNLDPVELFGETFEIIAGKAGAEKIKEAFGDDAALYLVLFRAYMEDTEAGEASPSQG